MFLSPSKSSKSVSPSSIAAPLVWTLSTIVCSLNSLRQISSLFSTYSTSSSLPVLYPLIGKRPSSSRSLNPEKNPKLVDGYRPITITANPSKVFERMMKVRLHWRLDRSNALPNFQAGFRHGYSTTDHILRLESFVKKAFNSSSNAYAVLLDLTKAYDVTWITALLFKLARLKVTGPFLHWLKNFLTGRSFSVRLNSFLSLASILLNGRRQRWCPQSLPLDRLYP